MITIHHGSGSSSPLLILSSPILPILPSSFVVTRAPPCTPCRCRCRRCRAAAATLRALRRASRYHAVTSRRHVVACRAAARVTTCARVAPRRYVTPYVLRHTVCYAMPCRRVTPRIRHATYHTITIIATPLFTPARRPQRQPRLLLRCLYYHHAMSEPSHVLIEGRWG